LNGYFSRIAAVPVNCVEVLTHGVESKVESKIVGRVADSTDNTGRGPLRSLYEWLTGTTPPSPAAPPAEATR
jgi:hypothetical protein